MPEEQDAVRVAARKTRAIYHICRARYNGIQEGLVPALVVLGAGILRQQVSAGCHRNTWMVSRTLPLVYFVLSVFE